METALVYFDDNHCTQRLRDHVDVGKRGSEDSVQVDGIDDEWLRVDRFVASWASGTLKVCPAEKSGVGSTFYVISNYQMEMMAMRNEAVRGWRIRKQISEKNAPPALVYLASSHRSRRAIVQT